MAVVSSCREMLGQVPQRAQPLLSVTSRPSGAGDSGRTAGDKPEEGGDDVKSSWPLCPGLHTCYNGRYKALRDGDVLSKSQKADLSSDWSLKPDSMKLESLVIAHQNGAVNMFPGLVHTARHTTRVGGTRSR